MVLGRSFLDCFYRLLDWLGVHADWTWAEFLNSQFLQTLVGAVVAVVVGWYGAGVRRAAEDTAVAQEAETYSAKAEALERDIVLEDEQPEVPAAENFREQAKSLIDWAKTHLDTTAKNDPDGRRRRTYDAISRYDYVPLAVALNVRGRISNEQLGAAVQLFSRWKKYERGRAASKPVSRAIFDEMQRNFDDLGAGAQNEGPREQ